MLILPLAPKLIHIVYITTSQVTERKIPSFSSVQSCPTLCDPMNHSTPGLPVHRLKDTPWKESYDQPRQHIEKQRHYFVNKGPSSQGFGFPVVMYGCESWTVKKAEPRRIDAFELWCWRRLLRVPWTVKRSNQSILKEIILGVHWQY